MTTVATPVEDPHRPLADGVGALAALAATLGRDDLAARLRVAIGRLTRPTTIICVVGEFKQGKSSLVNALLGEDICPVDDDLATSALTLVRHGDERRADVRRRVGEDVVVEPSAIENLGDWVSEAGNPGNAKGVERVDVTLPNDLLAKGIAIVDTPGMGSLGAGHAAATLAFLPFADALVFVSDASAELSAPEVDFLKRAGPVPQRAVRADQDRPARVVAAHRGARHGSPPRGRRSPATAAAVISAAVAGDGAPGSRAE